MLPPTADMPSGRIQYKGGVDVFFWSRERKREKPFCALAQQKKAVTVKATHIGQNSCRKSDKFFTNVEKNAVRRRKNPRPGSFSSELSSVLSGFLDDSLIFCLLCGNQSANSLSLNNKALQSYAHTT